MESITEHTEVLVPVAPSDKSGPMEGGSHFEMSHGKRLGLYWNRKPNGDVLLRRFGARLAERYETDAVWLEGKNDPARAAMAETLEEARLKCDAVLLALGD